MELLEPRQYLAAVSWDDGGGDKAWNNPLNWSTDALPGSDDDVVIASAGTDEVTFASGSVTVHSLVLYDRLNVSSGSLNVSGSLMIDAGQLTIGGQLKVTGSTTVANAGLLDAAGDVELGDWAKASDGAIQASTGSLKLGSKNASDRGQVRVFSGATLTIAGVNDLADFDLNAGSNLLNRGSLTIGGSYSLSNVDFTNSGTLDWDTTATSLDGFSVRTEVLTTPWTSEGTTASQGTGSSTQTVTTSSYYHFDPSGQSLERIENAQGTYDYQENGVSVTGTTSRHSQVNESIARTSTRLTRTTESADLWSYSGSGTTASDQTETGPLSDDTTGTYTRSTQASGTLTQGGSGSASSHLTAVYAWDDLTTPISGSGDSYIQSQASHSISGSGTYAVDTVFDGGSSHLTGTHSYLQSVDSSSTQTLSLAIDDSGQWTITYGFADAQGSSTDSSWYDGVSGSVTESSSDSGSLTGEQTGTYSRSSDATGSSSEGGTSGSTTSYSVHSEWTGINWVQSGQSTSEWDDSGHSGVTTTGTYDYSVALADSNASTTGSTGTTYDQEWSNTGSLT